MTDATRAGGGVIDTTRFRGQFFEIMQDTGAARPR
jgi:hypothetical protein